MIMNATLPYCKKGHTLRTTKVHSTHARRRGKVRMMGNFPVCRTVWYARHGTAGLPLCRTCCTHPRRVADRQTVRFIQSHHNNRNVQHVFDHIIIFDFSDEVARIGGKQDVLYELTPFGAAAAAAAAPATAGTSADAITDRLGGLTLGRGGGGGGGGGGGEGPGGGGGGGAGRAFHSEGSPATLRDVGASLLAAAAAAAAHTPRFDNLKMRFTLGA